LDEIVDLAGRTECLAQTPHDGLGAPNQLADRDIVALARCIQQRPQPIHLRHTAIMARSPEASN
jgi:hypothetical protein